MLQPTLKPTSGQIAKEFQIETLEPREEMLSTYGHDREVSHPDGYPIGEDLPADC